VLRLRDGHAITRNDHDKAGLLQHLRGAFGRFGFVDFLFPAGLRLLHLAERTKQARW